MRALSIAATGMQAQQLHVEVISNNLANMNTSGYKRQRAEFQDLIYQNQERPGQATSAQGNLAPVGVQIGLGVQAGAVGRLSGQGPLTQTGNTYDMAINGAGYFQVTLPDGGTAYTRAGAFAIDAEGRLVTVDGYLVEPAITVPGEAAGVSVSRDGVVVAAIPGQIEGQQLGQIELATFINPAGLEAVGDNLFLESAASGAPVVGAPGAEGRGMVLQRWIENANVNAVEEITALITAQRAYEMNSRVISAADEMLQTASQLR